MDSSLSPSVEQPAYDQNPQGRGDDQTSECNSNYAFSLLAASFK